MSHKSGGISCLLVVVTFAFLSVFAAAPQTDIGWEVGAGAIAVTCGILLPILIFLPIHRIAAKRFYAEMPSFFNVEQLTCLDESGVWQGSQRGFSFVPWSNLQSVMIGSKRMVGLQHDVGIIYVIPKSAFASEEAMRGFLDFAAERIAIAAEPVVVADFADVPPDSGNPYQPPNAPPT